MVSDNVIAILLGILANSLYNIGLVFKKKGACTLPDIEKQSLWQNIKNFARCKVWVFGYLLTIIQWFPLMYAINIGALSVVAPTMGIGFIVLILFSWLYLKEPISLVEIFGIFIVIGAVISINVVQPTETGNLTISDMNQFFREGNAIAFLVSFAIIVGILIAVTWGRKYRQAGGLLAMASGLCYAIATIFAKGAIGSFRSGLLRDALRSWEFYIYLLLMCIGYTVAFSAQQMAFQKGKAIVVSPTLDIMNLLTQITAGILIFNEWVTIWGTMLPWQKAVKTISIGLIIIGVAMLSIFTAEYEETTGGQKEEEITDEEEVLETTEVSESSELKEKKPFSLKEKIGTQKIEDSSTTVGHQK